MCPKVLPMFLTSSGGLLSVCAEAHSSSRLLPPLTGNVVPQLCLPPEPGKQVPRASGTLALRGGRACPTSITLF